LQHYTGTVISSHSITSSPSGDVLPICPRRNVLTCVCICVCVCLCV
jgi:hypothetical protein